MEYLTITDLKKLLHIGNDKAYSLVQMNSFPSFRLGEGGQWLIDPEGLKKWLEKIQKLPDKGVSVMK